MTLKNWGNLGTRVTVILAGLAGTAVATSTVLALPADPDPAPGAAIASARALSEAFSGVAERVSPSVVSIRVQARRPASPGHPWFGPGPEHGGQLAQGAGSGFALSADGHILTNHHVVHQAEHIEVLLHDGRRFPATVVGTDAATDLAVLKIEATGLRPLSFADSEQARVGQWVVAIGSPFGLDYTVTAGVLSGTGRGGFGANEIEDYLQTDASINPGNSGGPLIDLDGRVLGVNTMIIGGGTGIGFAVPSAMARRVADQLIRRGGVQRAWIGVSFQELTPELASHLGTEAGRRGALVAEVIPGGPADRAGLEAGDVIVSVGQRPVREGRDLLRAVLAGNVGATLELGVLRQGRRQGVRLTTGERPAQTRSAPPQRPDASASAGAGLSLGQLRPADRRRLGFEARGDVVVRGVSPGSPAARVGILPGDIVLAADRRPVRRPEDVRRAMSDGRALLRVQRHDRTRFFALSLSPS